jgi:hypothetical protein
MTKNLFAYLLFYCLALISCSNTSCEDWFEGANCEIQERDKYCGAYWGDLSSYDHQGNLVSSFFGEITIVRSPLAINELQSSDDMIFVLDQPKQASFHIPNYTYTLLVDTVQQTVESVGEGAFNGKTLFLELNSLDGESSLTFFGSK